MHVGCVQGDALLSAIEIESDGGVFVVVLKAVWGDCDPTSVPVRAHDDRSRGTVVLKMSVGDVVGWW